MMNCTPIAFYDQEVIGHNPWYQFSDEEQSIFFSLINAVALAPTTNSDVVRDTTLKEWQTRGVAFSQGHLSLISVLLLQYSYG